MNVMEAYGYSGENRERSLSGKTAIVTGGNKGLGLEVVKSFAKAGCKVILCSRSVEAGEKAIVEEVMDLGHGGYAIEEDEAKKLIKVMELDLASFKSVDSFIEQLRIDNVQKVDYLFLNAGVMSIPTRETTEDGFEMQIGVNHFGHAYLTKKLLAILNGIDPIRVVVVSSIAWALLGNMSTSNLLYDPTVSDRKYSGWGAYGQSKLANAMYQPALDKLLKEQRGTESAAVTAMPGLVKTDLWQHTRMKMDTWGGWLADIIYPKKSIPQGAASLLMAALEPSFGDVEETLLDGDRDSGYVKMVNDCQVYNWMSSKNAKFFTEESTDAFYDLTMQMVNSSSTCSDSKGEQEQNRK